MRICRLYLGSSQNKICEFLFSCNVRYYFLPIPGAHFLDTLLTSNVFSNKQMKPK
jgi:hypothetical protein